MGIREDCPSGDHTIALLDLPPRPGSFRVIAKQDGVLSGVWLWDVAFQWFGSENFLSHKGLSWARKRDGDRIVQGDVIVSGEASWDWVLLWERTLLNLLSTMSGIATATADFEHILRQANSTAHISETRKILPGLRDLAKYSVRCGGGINHRRDLSSGVLIKENHIAAAGGITQVLQGIQRHDVSDEPWEMELASESDVDEIVMLQSQGRIPSQLKWLMLDNFTPEAIARSLAKLKGFSIELSGGITLANVHSFASFPVQRISVGSLTHSFKAVDFSLLMDRT